MGFKAHRLLYYSTLGLRVIKKRKVGRGPLVGDEVVDLLDRTVQIYLDNRNLISTTGISTACR